MNLYYKCVHLCHIKCKFYIKYLQLITLNPTGLKLYYIANNILANMYNVLYYI